MAATLSSASTPAQAQKLVRSPDLATPISWQPPTVEEVVDEDGQESPGLKDAWSPATPTTSVTSFESGTDDEKVDGPPSQYAFSSPTPRRDVPPSQGSSNRSNTSAPLARRSQPLQLPSPRRDAAATRVIREPWTEDHHSSRQEDSHLKNREHALHLPSMLHPTVSRITPATLSTIFPSSTSPIICVPPSPTSPSFSSTSPRMTAADMPSPLSPLERPKVRFRDRGPPVIHVRGRPGCPQPVLPENSSYPSGTSPDVVSVEQTWGVLFDAGYSTTRLGHVLRGLAALVINRFGSAGDVVVTPEAMRGMYAKYTLGEDEVWLYHDLFEQSSSSDIGALYQDMECRHHLIQELPRSKPAIPGLTVDGWATWMAANILAYPDQECRRLNKMLADFPPLTIPDGPDGESIILPMTLPRQCLPGGSDRKTRAELNKAIEDVLKDSEDAYVTSRPPRDSMFYHLSPGRLNAYTYLSDSRMSRHSIPRSNSDSQVISVARPLPFDSRVRAPSPPAENRNAARTPSIGRIQVASTTHHRKSHHYRDRDERERVAVHVRDSRRQGRRRDNPTYEDYFQTSCQHRDLDSSPERSPRSRHRSDTRAERRRREKS